MRALPASAMIIALLLAGCSNSTEGAPAAQSNTGPVMLNNPKRIGEGADRLKCDQLFTVPYISGVVGATAEMADDHGAPGCEMTVRPPDGSQDKGRVNVAVITELDPDAVKKLDDFNDNSAYQVGDAGNTQCDSYVAVADGQWLRVVVRLTHKDRGKVCDMSKRLARGIWMTMPAAG